MSIRGLIVELSLRLRLLFQDFIRSLFPPRCIICYTSGAYLCARHTDFQPATNTPTSPLINQIFVATTYKDPIVEALVQRWKYKGLTDVTDIIASALIDHIPKDLHAAMFVPIPLHWTRYIWRGYNQSYLLSKALQKQGIGYTFRLLRKTRRTKQQATLDKSERVINVENAFTMRNSKSLPLTVVLVDDLYTTGSTLTSAAKVLRENGIQNVYAVVFAHA